jgi:4-diphosphocytidyl-2-C-methyl-D-erythritol kinase
MPTWESNRVIKAKAPAKVNLFLEVTAKRPDGYHEISSVVAPVSLFDELSFEKSDRIELACDTPGLPADESNLVVKAARILKESRNISAGVRVTLDKRIPVGAGLGGGSSDAAAAITALNELWELGLTREEMVRVAAETGSDVPLFLYDGVVHVRGRGEKVVEIENNLREFPLVLATVPFGLSTAEVYRRVRIPDTQHLRSAAGTIEGFLSGDWELVARNTFNRLQEAAFKKEPQLEELFESIADATHLPVSMSGSGSAFFVCCESAEASAQVGRLLKEVEEIHAVGVSVLKHNAARSPAGAGR